jgi:hypothetical protein
VYAEHSFVYLLIIRIKGDIINLKRLASSPAVLWGSDIASGSLDYLFNEFELYSAAQ